MTLKTLILTKYGFLYSDLNLDLGSVLYPPPPPLEKSPSLQPIETIAC